MADHAMVTSYVRGRVYLSCRCGRNLGKHPKTNAAVRAYGSHLDRENKRAKT